MAVILLGILSYEFDARFFGRVGGAADVSYHSVSVIVGHVSPTYGIRFSVPDYKIRLTDGQLSISTSVMTDDPDDVSATGRNLSFGGFEYTRRQNTLWLRRIKIPLWMPLIAFAAYPVAWSVILAGRAHRRRRRKGRCVECGYDVRTNTHGICPECATPIPEDQAVAV